MMGMKTNDQKMKHLFGTGWSNTRIFATSSAAEGFIKRATVNIWEVDASGKKVASTKKIRVHAKLTVM